MTRPVQNGETIDVAGLKLQFFADKTVGLHVHRGVVEFVSDLKGYYRQPDIAMTLDGNAWLGYTSTGQL